MKRFFLVTLAVALVGATSWFVFHKITTVVGAEVTVKSSDDVIAQVLANRQANLEAGESADFGADNEVVVLLLGLDARKGDEHPHCDAIHFFTLDLEAKTIQITSVPRGTYAYIPGRHAASEYYLSNSCALEGIDYGIEQIEKVAGIKHDYLVTVGFSQTLGILRLFDLPTTSTLQWLRHRQSYSIGEPQRTHNQAVFMKDMIVAQLHRFREDFSLAMQYILYQTLETDLDFPSARALLQVYLEAEIDGHPENITLSMKPAYPVVDYHLDVDNADAQVQALVDYLKPYLSHEDLSLRTMESIQAELAAYLLERSQSDESLSDVVEKQLWLQVEDDETREDLHHRVIIQYTSELAVSDSVLAIDLLTEYILEMETLGYQDFADLAKAQLRALVNE